VNADAVWPTFVLMSAALGLVALPMFRFIDSGAEAGSRHASIDGLRGFLAFGVFVFHLVMTRRFIQTGQWQAPDSGFHALLGPVGVSLFFMITGFLFWGKLLRTRGRPDWRALFVGRLWRIAPMYLFVVVVMLGLVFARTGIELHTSAAQLVLAVAQWLALGLIDTQPDVNGQAAGQMLAGVTWTLFYEWAFYASLLGSALFARARSHLPFVVLALALCLAGKIWLQIDAMGFAVLFLCGMLVASLLHQGLRPALPDTLASGLALACLVLIFGLSRSGYGSFNAALLALFFYLVCSGVTLFGLLVSMPARRLGNISYSLYLMQGLVLSMVYAIEPLRAAANESLQMHWLIGLACAALLVTAAALGYAGIEKPGIALGQRLLRRHGPRRRLGTTAAVLVGAVRQDHGTIADGAISARAGQSTR
jgi:peptidoglycan/LPS O-acetylase OafA/YrhL